MDHPAKLIGARTLALATLVALLCVLSASKGYARHGRRLFFLQDVQHKQWCAYESEPVWTSEVKRLGADSVATVDYADDRVSNIALSQQDETGDWMVSDHYAVNHKGELRKLKRIINILPGDRSEEELYMIADGKAKKQTHISRKLSTGKTLRAPEEVWLPQVPIVTRLQDFPFAALARDTRPDLWPESRKCISPKTSSSPRKFLVSPEAH